MSVLYLQKTKVEPEINVVCYKRTVLCAISAPYCVLQVHCIVFYKCTVFCAISALYCVLQVH